MILRIMTVNRELEASGSQKMRGEVILLAFLFALFSIHCNESTQTADRSQQAQDFQNHAGADTGFGHGEDPGVDDSDFHGQIICGQLTFIGRLVQQVVAVGSFCFGQSVLKTGIQILPHPHW